MWPTMEKQCTKVETRIRENDTLAASSVSHSAAGKADYAIPEDNVFIDSHSDNSFHVFQ